LRFARTSSTSDEFTRKGRSLLVHGGPDFAKSLTSQGLVDEFQLSTVPIAIGAGRSPFADLKEHLKLEVVDEQRFRSGALAQVLVPKR
jgi:riboflavin biosynthesis pyrimidine reductase